MKVSATLLFLGLVVLAGTHAAASPQVTTIAGSGVAGHADGPAHTATFFSPAGVAAGRDGSIFISDRGTQQIRVLTPSGTVRTIAGAAALPGAGGFRDGAALAAKFDGPEGLAIGPGGAIFVADSHNGCVRKILRGRVSTFLGKCGERRVVDGPVSVARLGEPRGLAFDKDGTLYIADDGAGLRKLKGGTLTSITFKNYHGRSSHGVTFVAGPVPLVLVATDDGVVAYRPSTGQDEMFGATPGSTPGQVSAVDPRWFVLTDSRSQNIRYFRLPVPPFVGQFSRVIAGHASERASLNAGFADGPRTAARFNDPAGIVITGNKAIVADAGNHRIREITLPNLRFTETGFDQANQTDDRHYEVALVGASWSFWDAIGDDSICAQIEKTLDKSHRFGKPVRCHTITIDGALSAAMEDYIKSVLPYERMDLVIMDAESWSYYHLPTDRVAGGVTYSEQFRSRMQALLDVLTPLRTKLALVWIYPAQLLSDAEWIIDQPPGAFRPLPFDRNHEISTQMQDALRGMPILQYDMYADMLKYQLSLDALPLYRSNDQHPNPRGNAFFGDHFARGLLSAGLGL